MAETSPQDVKATERLHQYWVHGEGAAKIRWGAPGDFDRCVMHLGKFIKDPKGYCADAHHAALGIWPATHAAEIKHATRRSAVTTPDSDGDYDGDGLDSSWDGDHGDLPDLTGLGVEHMQAAEQAMGVAPPDDQVSRAMPKLGTGARFAKLKSSLAAKGASNPGALAAYIGRRKYGKAKFTKLASKARGGGVSRGKLVRYCQLEDIHILRTGEGDGTGRCVEGYAAVFEQPVEIRDGQGHYEEIIDRQAFTQWLARTERRPGGIGGAVRCLYNHGKTMEGLPAPEFQRPLGRVLEIRPDSRGVLTRTEYKKSPLAEEILDDIREGRLTAQSFEGPDYVSDPPLPAGAKYRKRGGVLPRVRRMVLGMTNFGPALYAAYQGAEFLGVRMGGDTLEDFDGPEDEEFAPAMEGDGTGGTPEDVTSARYHQHALYRLRAQEQRERIGLHW